MPTPSSLASNGLVKKTLAEKLLAEIMNGTLSPGTRIIEGKWAQHFGVAQGTIREAINLLERDGFVSKEGGRSARVVHLTEQDVIQLYQMRSAVEGLAAQSCGAGAARLFPSPIHRGWDAASCQGKECAEHARLGPEVSSGAL